MKGFVKIKELPTEERPREKLFRKGATSLTNIELLAILLGTGTRTMSAVGLAERILAYDPLGLAFLRDCEPEQLSKINGIGPAKACILIASIELGKRLAATKIGETITIGSPWDASSFVMEEMRGMKKEHFRVLLLNTKNQVIMKDDVSIGTLNSAEAHPREVFTNAIKKSAASVVLVHNHPSGNPEPSEADLLITQRLVKAGEILGIAVLDHIIIGDGSFISLRQEGKM